jgi:hypothetical protein
MMAIMMTYGEMGQLGVDELLCVVNPFIQDFSQETAFREYSRPDQDCEKIHSNSSFFSLYWCP